MTFLSWRQDYFVGVPQIDAEHQHLFSLINQFHDKYASGDTHKDLLQVLSSLVAYAELHFQHEEALMQEIAYPRLARQQQMHENLYYSIYSLNEKLSRHDAKVDSETLIFLKTWLVEHVLKEDMDIGEFMQRKAAATEKLSQKQIEPPNAKPSPAKPGTAPSAQQTRH